MRPSIKYQVIFKHKDKYNVNSMCKFFEISRSGYYAFLKRMDIPDRDLPLTENFFSILKTECIHRVKLSGYDEARLIISEYINFYNNYRIQTKTKLTSLKKRNQFVA